MRCQNFVIELRSPSDRAAPLPAKLEEYVQNGCRLGGLIDRAQKRVEIYRPGQAVEILSQPSTLSGELVLSGLVVSLAQVW